MKACQKQMDAMRCAQMQVQTHGVGQRSVQLHAENQFRADGMAEFLNFLAQNGSESLSGR